MLVTHLLAMLVGTSVKMTFFFPQLVDISQRRLQTGQKSGHVKPPKICFIYCSGVRVHGSSKKPINDLLPVGTPGGTDTSISDCELEAWR